MSNTPINVCGYPKIADTAGAKPVHAQIEEIKTLMLEWINVKAGAPARAKWSEIDARLNALAAAPSITAMTDEQIVALADTHAFDTDKRIVQFARALLATPAPSVADAASDRNALFGRVTDWMNEHRIPFDAQNELFRILSAYVAANAENEQLRERIAELERDIELSQKLR